MRILFALLLVSLLTACSHSLEIVGEGDIVSASGERDCLFTDYQESAKRCSKNLVIAKYQETYTAVPRDGWEFVGWEGCGSQQPDCSISAAGAQVSGYFSPRQQSLRAVFDVTRPQRNILLIIADDLSFDAYGFAGHAVLKTPSLDALAAQSVRFPEAYVSSTCRPTFATLLTGLPEQGHNVTHLKAARLGNYKTIANRLSMAGYTTYQAGKFWEGNPSSRGFSKFLPFDAVTGNLTVGRTSVQPLLDLLSEASSPWFMWFSPKMPHSPHNAPDDHREQYLGLGLDAATVEYYAMISWLDAAVGAVLGAVPEDTVVVYLADNGYVQSHMRGFPVLHSKASSFEQGVRTQLLVRHAGYPAVLRHDLASAVDVTATILAIANADHADLPGRDLLSAGPAIDSVFGSWSTRGTPPEKPLLRERWARSGDWKIVDVAAGDDRLYNLATDPNETQNLMGSPDASAVESQLRQQLEAWWIE